jgi:hypothetical protein
MRNKQTPIKIIVILLVLAVSVGLPLRTWWIQNRHINAIIENDLDSRLVPHRINRISQLNELLADGFQSLEVDVLFRADSNSGYFEIGHGDSDTRGVRLDSFLSKLAGYDTKKLWLDLKNLTPESVDSVLQALESLDSRFGIKSIAIVESGITDSAFARIRVAGFHTSYYLPTRHILELLYAGDTGALQHEAERLALQTTAQQVAAVSFDLRLYEFVKRYLEPLLDSTVVYHTWDSVSLWEWGALDDLMQQDYYNDPRVATILVKYDSD